MPVRSDPVVVPAEHPSLDNAVALFLADLRSERRFMGPSAAANPMPGRDLVDALARPDGGFRLASVEDGRVVALARVDQRGDLRVAVAADRRGVGIGTHLTQHVVDRARARGEARLCLRSSDRGGPSVMGS